MQILSVLILLLVFIFAVANTWQAIKYKPQNTAQKKSTIQSRPLPHTAQNLILEQVELWEYSGPRTGAYYAKQQEWTARARHYVEGIKHHALYQTEEQDKLRKNL
ncbi:hypothetical protein KIH87_18115 [Paraneptunicella aestuarii]|uniref:hypothetical protein n=1 Tax=Paraneptunicella aestuarii TaxID=2831148 RepID=UPI001E5331E4|nr:hypothetical protein [Paraneptunicella aestuarii]UAA38557.1 hypothetical protein KIH87_18115 [Paraneptunicella aestuarii]